MRFLGGIFGVFFGILERKKLPDNFQNKAKGAESTSMWKKIHPNFWVQASLLIET